MSNKITHLNFLILGLLNNKAQSGYELCKVIQNTPMSLLSDSPGSIYPALKKLEAMAYITGVQQQQGARKRREFQVTAAGLQALKSWLVADVNDHLLINSPSVILLKFSFIDLLSTAQQQKLLDQLSKQLDQSVQRLSAFHTAAKGDLAHGGAMAFELAVALLKTQADFIRHANRAQADVS